MTERKYQILKYLLRDLAIVLGWCWRPTEPELFIAFSSWNLKSSGLAVFFYMTAEWTWQSRWDTRGLGRLSEEGAPRSASPFHNPGTRAHDRLGWRVAHSELSGGGRWQHPTWLPAGVACQHGQAVLLWFLKGRNPQICWSRMFWKRRDEGD